MLYFVKCSLEIKVDHIYGDSSSTHLGISLKNIYNLLGILMLSRTHDGKGLLIINICWKSAPYDLQLYFTNYLCQTD